MGKQENKKQRNNTKQQFLLTFFTGEGYEVKELNGFVLVKYKNGDTGNFEVAIYTPESYKNAQTFLSSEPQSLFS